MKAWKKRTLYESCKIGQTSRTLPVIYVRGGRMRPTSQPSTSTSSLSRVVYFFHHTPRALVQRSKFFSKVISKNLSCSTCMKSAAFRVGREWCKWRCAAMSFINTRRMRKSAHSFTSLVRPLFNVRRNSAFTK